jgi:hypothetical protein
VGPRTSVDDVSKRKLFPPRDSNSDPSAIQLVASRYTDCAFPTQLLKDSEGKLYQAICDVGHEPAGYVYSIIFQYPVALDND